MPKAAKKKWNSGKKYRPRKSTAVARVPRPPKGFAPPPKKYGLGRMYGIERKCYLPAAFSTTIPGGVMTGTGWEIIFSLSALPNYTELTVVFDQYSIQKVKTTFYPKFNSSVDVAAGSGPMGTLSSIFAAVDTDSSAFGTLFTGPGPVLERQGSLVRRTDTPFVMTIQPKSATMMYKSPVTTGYGESADGFNWIDCNDASVPHYGLRGWLDFPPRTGYTLSYDVLCEYSIVFKEIQ